MEMIYINQLLIVRILATNYEINPRLRGARNGEKCGELQRWLSLFSAF